MLHVSASIENLFDAAFFDFLQTSLHSMNNSMRILAIALLGLQFAFSSPLRNSVGRRDPGTVRLVQYVQTFRDPHNTQGTLSLLPLLKEKTSVTHVNLAALHLNEMPGDITLNDDPPSSPMYDSVWSDVKTLQQGGVKVTVMVGGAAQGTYGRLCRSSDGGIVSLTLARYDTLLYAKRS